MKKQQRLVVKFGTENLFGSQTHLSQEVFDEYARQIAMLYADGIEVVVVTSGAIAAGARRVLDLGRDRSLFSKKELASIGTRHLCNMWGRAFEHYGLDVAPVLVTYANWKDAKERGSIKKSLIGCCSKSIVPLVNENDVVSDEEILSMEKGISENDRLARMVGVLLEVDGVLFLTNVPGVYTHDPKNHEDAKLLSSIDFREVLRTKECRGTTSQNGRGGMARKSREAAVCKSELPCAHVVIAGSEKNCILKFSTRDSIGTCVCYETISV